MDPKAGHIARVTAQFSTFPVMWAVHHNEGKVRGGSYKSIRSFKKNSDIK